MCLVNDCRRCVRLDASANSGQLKMDANCKYEFKISEAHVRWSMRCSVEIENEWIRHEGFCFHLYHQSTCLWEEWVAYVGSSWLLPPVFVRLVLLASVGVSRGLLRESGGSDSMCGCWLWWCGLEKIPFCCTAPPAIIFYKEAVGSLSFSLHAIRRYVVSKCETTMIWMFGVRRSSVAT